MNDAWRADEKSTSSDSNKGSGSGTKPVTTTTGASLGVEMHPEFSVPYTIIYLQRMASTFRETPATPFNPIRNLPRASECCFVSEGRFLVAGSTTLGSTPCGNLRIDYFPCRN